jgi:chemotaxis signal transduction protein
VLDTAALMATCPESCISLRGERESTQGASATSAHTWLVFESAGSYATRIDCVQEIVPVPASLRPRLEAGLDVTLPWRGHAVPVRDLFAGHGLAAAARLLIVVEAEGRRIAVPIVGVKAMIAPRTATLARLRVRAELVDVVSTAAGTADRASYEVVDLEARASAEPGLRRAA